jgi:predicted MPP superfamily phosphohydrolase
MNFRKRVLTTFLIIASIGCKTTSYTSTPPYGVDKGDNYFSIAVLPDTQYYTAERYGGTMQMFTDQIQWIKSNRKNEKIAYVIHLGDITDRNTLVEWDRAKDALYQLDEAKIPYGLTLGNHDEAPNETFVQGDPNTIYTKYFGTEHFKDKPWFGGSVEKNGNNDTHFDVFSANGDKFLVMYFSFNEENRLVKVRDTAYEKKVMHWADSVLNKYADHKAIMVAHSMLNRTKTSKSEIMPGTTTEDEVPEHTKQGKQIYNMAKKHPNVFLMLGGHIAGESFRRDELNGNVIKTYLSDYQSRRVAPYTDPAKRDGGGGLMRLMRFNKTKQSLSVVTFAPKANGQIVKEEDGDSQFTHPLFK